MLGVTLNDGSTVLGGERTFGIGITGGNAGGVEAIDSAALNQPNPSTASLAAMDTGLALSTGVNLIVARIRDSANPDTTEDDMTVWVNPTLGVEPVAGGVDLGGPAFAWVANNASWGVNSVFASHTLDTGNSVVMDELRYGNTYADVTPFTTIPEPSSLLLIGLAVAGILAVKRRTF